MATFPRLFSAIGRRFTTYFHSFLLFFSSGFFGKGLMTFLLRFRGQDDQGTAGLLEQQQQQQQQQHSESSSSDLQPQSQSQSQTVASRVDESEEGGNTTTTTNTETTTATSSSSSSSEAGGEDYHQSLQATDADDERDINDDNYLIYDTDDEEMASSATGSGGRRGPLPKIVPALPLVPIPTRRKTSSSTVKASKQQQDSAANLSDEFAQLNPFGQPGALAEKQHQESAASVSVSKSAQKSLQVVTNGSTPTTTITKENVVVDIRDKGKEPARVFLDENKVIIAEAREVVRFPAVPINHEVSQNSNLKTPGGSITSTISFTDIAPSIRAPDPEETPEQAAERKIHSGFMRDALDMARLALKTNETPVGCVLVYRGRVIAKGMNATNITRNGTRHAELMAISALLSYTKDSDYEVKKKGPLAKGKKGGLPLGDRTNDAQAEPDESAWGDVDPRDGHIYPYGQKLHPSPRVDRSIINECVLYVTVEPCIMCASLLRQLGIKKVYFGAVNDKFGGTGGVFRIHKNSPLVMASCPPSPTPQNGKGIARPTLERRPVSTSNIPDCQGSSSSGDDKSEAGAEPFIDPATLPGDGGNIERGYDAEGGWGRDEAVTLLRQFYVQENGRAPVPRKKEGRAARLAAMMERDGHAGGPMIEAGAVLPKTGENGEENSDSAKEGECLESGGGESLSSGASDNGATSAAN